MRRRRVVTCLRTASRSGDSLLGWNWVRSRLPLVLTWLAAGCGTPRQDSTPLAVREKPQVRRERRGLRVPVQRRMPAWASADPRVEFHPTLGLPLEVVHETTGIPMVLVATTVFQMGGPADSPADDGAVRPPVEVRLRPFYIAKYELTQAQFQDIRGGDIPSSLRRRAESFGRGNALQAPLGDWFPCTGFSWADLAILLDRADARLPTEAEWECACYGTARRSEYPLSRPELVLQDVRRTEANDLGIHGMIGNAAELCADPWPAGPGASGTDDLSLVLRGYYTPWWRCPYDPKYEAVHVGLRLARDP